MDPGLLELIASGEPGDEVAIIVRLHPGRAPPDSLRLIARFGWIATGRAQRDRLAAIHDHPAVASLKAPRIYAGEYHFNSQEPGIFEADPDPGETDQRRPAGLAETGRGTAIAVIDWGIDFAHPDFRGAADNSRFLAIWDQRGAGNPAPYGYGQIHPRAAIDRALASADPFAALGYQAAPMATPAHGTHVLGIAAGNGRAGGPSGMAPEADLIFVHLGPGLGDLGNSVDLLEAIDFAVRTADDRPLAINLSIGRHAGPHDGTLLIEQAIDWLILNRPGTVVVQSAGNYFSRNVHMQGRLYETSIELLPFNLPASDQTATTVELWYQGADRFQAAAVSPDGVRVEAARGTNVPLHDRAGHLLGTLYHRAFDPNNGDHLISLVLRPQAPPGDWTIEIAGVDVVDGRWHAWIERNAACPKCQGTFPRASQSSKSTTGSICNALRTIAVGAYDGHDPDHPLAVFSSMGPTRDGRPKPLLVAPGVKVLSVRSRADAAQPAAYVRMSGTSMAAPHVTGTVALMLQAAGAQPLAAIRQALFSTLQLPLASERGALAERWGFGLLDCAAAVTAARRLRASHQPLVIPPWTAVQSSPAIPTHPAPEGQYMAYASESTGDAESTGTTLADRPRSGDEPRSILTSALDPSNPGMQVVAWGGRRLQAPLLAGDFIVSRAPGAPMRSYILNSDISRSGHAEAEVIDLAAIALDSPAKTALLRLYGPDRLLRGDLTVLRANSGEHSALGESPMPPLPSRPIIRPGSRGPAVIDAQQRLNRIDQLRLSQGQSRITACPLEIDGVFGSHTRHAIVSFQQLAFPAQPPQWDGVIGPTTWAQLDLWSYGRSNDPPIIPRDIPPSVLAVIPVTDHPLDPARWGPILAPLLSPDAKLRSGNAVRSLIDGRECFEQMEVDIRSANGANDYVYLLGWDMVTDFDLVPTDRRKGIFPHACPIGGKENGQGRTIIDALQFASDHGVQVRVMLWAKPPLSGSLAVARINLMKNGAAIRDDETANKTGMSTARLILALQLASISPAMVPVIVQAIQPDLIRMTGAHHQKVLIIKRGETLIAYCGGIDFNSNRLYSDAPQKGDPQHDTHCRIVGPAAWDLLDTFRRRWNHHPASAAIDRKVPLRGAAEPVPVPLTRPSPNDSLSDITCSAIIARTFNPVHKTGSMRPERDIQRLLVASIASARRFIYFEDQYLFDYPDPRFPATLDMASALNAAVPNIQHLTILLPANGLAVPFVDGHYRKNFIDRLLFGLSAADRLKVGIFQPSHSQQRSMIGCHDYVHSKCWIFDDELAMIGSANCNRRGYQHDSEVNAFIFDDPPIGPSTDIARAGREWHEQAPGLRPTFAQFLRARLWSEHLGVPLAAVRDGLTAAFLWRTAGRPASARIIDFDVSAVSTRITNAQAEALREFIDPVP